MAGFERVLMPGLDKDQYSVLWVEHRDKGRLELNFLVPNTELLTGRRLQPYYDRADRGERATGAARPERAGEPARAGYAIFVTQNEAGSRRGHYAGFTGPRLVRGA
ncbi:TPA: relaxase/mobilization nuclease domain-containing protein [Escherichia coli]